jgi:hypothetical protein
VRTVLLKENSPIGRRTLTWCLARCVNVLIATTAAAQNGRLAIEYTVKVADIPGQLFQDGASRRRRRGSARPLDPDRRRRIVVDRRYGRGVPPSTESVWNRSHRAASSRVVEPRRSRRAANQCLLSAVIPPCRFLNSNARERVETGEGVPRARTYFDECGPG